MLVYYPMNILFTGRGLYIFIPRVQCLCDGGDGITLIGVFTPAGRCGGSVRRVACTVLYCTVLYCTVLYCTVLHCNVSI